MNMSGPIQTEGRNASNRGSLLSRWRRLRALWRDQRGATAIEFALVSLPVIYLMVGIIEFSVAMTVANSLEAATNLSSRLGKTGYVADQLSQKQTIRDEVQRRVGPLIDMSKLTIQTTAFKDFEDLDTQDPWNDADGDGEPDAGEWTDTNGNGFCDGCSGLGSGENVAIYTITYPWKIMTPLIGAIVGQNGIITLTAYSVVKNEPY
jgi:Flp pilus assembly pilin Flp